MSAPVIRCSLALILLLGPSLARADEAPPPPDAAAVVEGPPRVHIDAEPGVALPLGDLAHVTGPAIGGLVGGGYTLGDRWELVGRTGYLWGTSTRLQVPGVSVGSSLSYAPVLAGVRYWVLDAGTIRPYAMAEAGAFLVIAGTTGSGGDTSGSSLYAGGAASLGLLVDVLDLRVGLLTADLGHAGTSTSALATLGFRFAAF
ncbi:MAG TPA: hypothetical protein VF765_36910 [Polyangiaceae bacterium]